MEKWKLKKTIKLADGESSQSIYLIFIVYTSLFCFRMELTAPPASTFISVKAQLSKENKRAEERRKKEKR